MKVLKTIIYNILSLLSLLNIYKYNNIINNNII